MSFIINKETWNIRNQYITDEKFFNSRRNILKKLAASSLICSGLSTLPKDVFSQSNSYSSSKVNNLYKVNRAITKESYATTYTNFYEFGSSKNIWRRAAKLKTRPWSITIDGLVKKPLTIDVDDLIRKIGGIEERIYRFRCVESWSMTVPWSGFPLKKILSLVEPNSKAKFIKFETFYQPDIAPGQKQKWYPWPYQEGLTIDEAKNDLSFLATGIYGKKLPNQNGAPLRLVIPWKYGFKSIKSIVKISLVSTKPKGLWETLAPAEYGFWANVNPQIPHPRWSQSTEQQLGIEGRVPTVIYNGYGPEVASLYSGLEKNLKDTLYR